MRRTTLAATACAMTLSCGGSAGPPVEARLVDGHATLTRDSGFDRADGSFVLALSRPDDPGAEADEVLLMSPNVAADAGSWALTSITTDTHFPLEVEAGAELRAPFEFTLANANTLTGWTRWCAGTIETTTELTLKAGFFDKLEYQAEVSLPNLTLAIPVDPLPPDLPPASAVGAAWSSAFGSPVREVVTGVALDPAGSVVVAGDSDGGIQDVPPGGFLARLDAKGAVAGGAALPAGPMLASASDAVAAGGTFNGTMAIGSQALVSSGGDVYVAKLGPGDEPLWARSFGDAAEQSLRGLAAGAGGEVLLAAGKLLWSRPVLASGGGATASSIAVDEQGRVLSTGTISATADFGFGAIELFAPVTYLLELRSDGTPLRSTAVGCADAQATGRPLLAARPGVGLALATSFMAFASVDQGPLESGGGLDVFAAKLSR